MGQLRLQLVIQRIARFLVPKQIVRFQRLGVFNRSLQIKTPIGIHGKIFASAHHLDHRFNTRNVISQRLAANLHLHHRIAEIEILLHLVLQLTQIFSRVVVTTRRIHKHLVVRFATVVTIGQQTIQRLALNLRHRIPHGHVHRADSHRALTMPARFFIGEHRGPNAMRVQVIARVIHQRLRISFHDARHKALRQQPHLRITAIGVKAKAHHRLAIADDIRHHRDDTRRHLGKINVRVADGRINRCCDGVYGGDAHCWPSVCLRRMSAGV